MKYVFYSAIVIYALVIAMCSQKKEEPVQVVPGIDETIEEQGAYAKFGKTKLSDYGFFVGKISDLDPSKDVLPYDLNAPLFSDYAKKKRFIQFPAGQVMAFKTSGLLEFPIGTTIIKNFYYSKEQLETTNDKIIETRLLIHEDKGWKALSYIWNDEQTEAYLEITGGELEVQLADQQSFTYNIPTVAQCKSCHDNSGKLVPIGPSIRQINKTYKYSDGSMNQLEKMVQIGWLENTTNLSELPRMVDYGKASEPIAHRARSYLDVNCAHCHNINGPAKNSGLSLSYFENDSYKLGVNKKPVAAGSGSGTMLYNIVPGSPEESILLHRMKITDPGTRMPEIGRSLIHKEGVELISNWIKSI